MVHNILQNDSVWMKVKCTIHPTHGLTKFFVW